MGSEQEGGGGGGGGGFHPSSYLDKVQGRLFSSIEKREMSMFPQMMPMERRKNIPSNLLFLPFNRLLKSKKKKKIESFFHTSLHVIY